tara:strand:+ start:897 stop:1571 length:675 start_codon:yes stop_codon:yes gene_type:complete
MLTIKRLTTLAFYRLLSISVVLLLPIDSKANQNTQIKILVLGDSLTAGYGLDKNGSFPAVLEKYLRASGWDTTIANGGVSGDTSAGGKNRLKWALTKNPDVVIIELGANDGLRGLNPNNTKENLAAILRELRQRKISVLLAGMLAPPNFGKTYGQEFKKIYLDLAREFNVPLYKFFLDGVAGKPALNQSDGIHPNKKGVVVIVERILPSVVSILKTLKKDQLRD